MRLMDLYVLLREDMNGDETPIHLFSHPEDVPPFAHGEAERLLFDLEAGGGAYENPDRALHWFDLELDAFRFHDEDDHLTWHWRLEKGVNVFLRPESR
jgi:hypothetical protein